MESKSHRKTSMKLISMESHVRTPRKPKQPWWRLTRDEVFRLLSIVSPIIAVILTKCSG